VACTPFPAPNAGLFENATQGVWLNANETKGMRSCTYSSGTLTVAAPNGSETFLASAGVTVRHKFFGTNNYLAVLVSGAGPGTVQRSIFIVDFTAPSMTSKQILSVLADSTNSLPWLQHSPMTGTVCLVGGPTAAGVVGISAYRSDNGAFLCAGPTPYTPSNQVIGEALASAIRIKDGGAIIGGPCAFPAGELDVQPNSQTFNTVKLGGCPQPPSTKQFTLKNIGNDCLTITKIDPVSPFAVTSQSMSFPAQLDAGQSMTATVTFSPGAVGSFSNIGLPVTRNPPKGDDKLICSGQAQTASAAFTASPSVVDFGIVEIGTSAAGSFTVKNTGDVPISINVAAAPVGSPFQWVGFSGSLNCGQQQAIAVTFTPQSESPVQATVTATSSPGGVKQVTLKGEGCIPNAAIVVPPAPFPAFGNVRQGYRMPRFITVENTGDDTLTFTATITGPDAALFGLMKASQSLTDILSARTYLVDPAQRCGGGSTGDGKEEVAVVFYANAAPPKVASATLTIDNHNAPTGPSSFSLPLTATVIAGNVVDVVAVFDTSGSMGDPVPGGGTKMAAAIQAGRLLVSLIPPDLRNRIGATRFATTATTFLGIDEVTTANQQAKVDGVKDPPLTPNGSTAIAAGVMTGLPEFAVPHAGSAPANLTKAMVVLTDGMDNTAFQNPADNQYYTILGGMARDPSNPFSFVSTQAFVPPSDVKIYAVGLGTGQDIDKDQLAQLSSGAGGYYGAVDPTQPAVAFQLMKFYTQIYMDLVDTSVIKDPRGTIAAGDKHVIEFDVLQGDVSAMIVMYDLDGLRLPFWLESPRGEIVDAAFVPGGFQLRAGSTEATRFLDFVLPPGEPERYAGRWRLIVAHQGKVCRGRPVADTSELGFLPRKCAKSKAPVEYGFAIGVGSNFRLYPYVTPGPLKVGDSIRLTGVLSEAGLPVVGSTVTVDALLPNGQSVTGIQLIDDGAHSDGDEEDGEYGRLFTQTPVAGTYTFTFRATGYTRDGEPVLREAVRSKYVEGTLKPPPHGGHGDGPGMGIEQCCKEILALLERQSELLSAIVEASRERQKA
jgi:HYDIN/CFA65/VesB family protein/von Willebrand factor type A domain-containing protein